MDKYFKTMKIVNAKTGFEATIKAGQKYMDGKYGVVEVLRMYEAGTTRGLVVKTLDGKEQRYYGGNGRALFTNFIFKIA